MLLSERDRRRARAGVNNALRDGRIHKPDRCERCGSTAPLDGHHADWRRPLDVEFLCRPCHRRADAWERRAGLRESTKTGRGRLVPLPSKVSGHLSALIAASPFREPDDLVFHCGRDGRRPVDHHAVLRVFYAALERIGVKPEQRQARRLVFHGYRHGLNTLLRASKVPDALVQRVTGHRTDAMTERYSHFALADFGDVARVQEGLFP